MGSSIRQKETDTQGYYAGCRESTWFIRGYTGSHWMESALTLEQHERRKNQ
jgi:hypothetical protein